MEGMILPVSPFTCIHLLTLLTHGDADVEEKAAVCRSQAWLRRLSHTEISRKCRDSFMPQRTASSSNTDFLQLVTVRDSKRIGLIAAASLGPSVYVGGQVGRTVWMSFSVFVLRQSEPLQWEHRTKLSKTINQISQEIVFRQVVLLRLCCFFIYCFELACLPQNTSRCVTRLPI